MPLVNFTSSSSTKVSMVYVLAIVLFLGWIVGLIYSTVGPVIHLLPLLAMFIIAMGQSKRKKHRLLL